MSDTPYKFLDYYSLDDAGIFFGRERETSILLSDIVVNRLVVLFAPTGTGKTSLINAGVRPRLRDQGYATFFVRVNEDPVESARAELLSHAEIDTLKGERLAEQLENVVDRLGRPIVIFFDQFEEFFIYVYNRNRERGREFIADIARLYHDGDSGVHTVFSMREEFFADMDAFRDEIPTIFHNDSNLRLRRFDMNQARDAIVYPARTFKVRMDSDLVDRLLADLSDSSSEEPHHSSEPGLIEPAQLQIVCDTLWTRSEATRKKEGRITFADYNELGGRSLEENVAKQVLYRRLEDGFKEIESPYELDLLARLLPLLKTREQTKYVRDIEALGIELNTDESLLEELLAKLERIRFIRRSKRDRIEVIELSHDYLVDRLDYLASRVRTIWPQRTLQRAFSTYQVDRQFAGPEDLDAIMSQLGSLSIGPPEAEFLLRSAIAIGADNMLALFNLAFGISHNVWPILQSTIREETGSVAINTLNLCRGIASQIKGDDPASPSITSEVFGLLSEALNRGDLTSKTQECLADLVALNAHVSSAAAKMLMEHLNKVMDKGRVATAAIEVLGRMETVATIKLLNEAIRRDDLTHEAQDALARHMSDPNEEVASGATNALLGFYADSIESGRISGPAIMKLASIQTKDSVTILSRALLGQKVIDEAKFALERLSNSTNAEVATAARKALADFHSRKRSASTIEEEVATDHSARSLEPSSEELQYIAEKIRRSECVLFLGPGIYVPPPQSSKYKYQDKFNLPLGAEVARFLAERSRYREEYPNGSENDLQQVAQHFELKFSRLSLIDNLRSIIQPGEPSALIRALARLPFSVIINTNFDNRLEQALIQEGKTPQVIVYDPDKHHKTPEVRDESPQQPVVLKLHGDLEQPESVVITQEDLIQFFLRMTDRMPYNPIPSEVQYSFLKFTSLQMGYSLRDFGRRLLLKSLSWGHDRTQMPPIYTIDSNPDPLLSEIWQNQRRLVTFIQQDLWTFMPELYRTVMSEEMPG